MHRIILLIVIFISFASCNNRTCECKEDFQVTSETEELYVIIPNAVNENCSDFIISINSRLELDIEAQSILFSKGDVNFLEGRTLSEFVERSGYVTSIPAEYSHFQYLLYFPIEIFETNDGLITNEMNIDISLTDIQGNKSSAIGTTYFYKCNDLGENFNAVDCRWPSQIDIGIEHWGTDCQC